jgi:hypothetical protein
MGDPEHLDPEHLQLTKEEFDNLKCHFGTSRWGGRRYLPYVFTENGIAMLSSVLSSKRAIQVNPVRENMSCIIPM